MSKQTFVMTPKNYPRPLEVFGEHAAMRVSGEAAIGSELFLKEGSRGNTERAATKTFRNMIHRLNEDVRSWYELHRLLVFDECHFYGQTTSRGSGAVEGSVDDRSLRIIDPMVKGRDTRS